MASFAAYAGWSFGTPVRRGSRRTAAGALALLLAAGAVAAVQTGHDPRRWAEARDEGPARPPEGAPEASVGMSLDGCGWQPEFLAPNLDGSVWAMTVFDDGTGPALYAGGDFVTASGVVVNRVARWDGSAWSALGGPSGTGTDGPVYALAVFDDGTGPALYAGGVFTTAGGVTVNGVARWDGSAWSGLSGPSGTGVSDSVYALAVFDDGTGPALYAGGWFITAGGVTVNYIARWDGSTWSALSGPSGTGVDYHVYALAVFDDGSGPALYAGGWFSTAGGVTVNYIARWDGSAWSALSGPSGTGLDRRRVAPSRCFDDGTGPALYAGGWFTHRRRGGGEPHRPLGRQRLVGAQRADRDRGRRQVYALAVFDDGSGPALYAGGEFITAGGVTVEPHRPLGRERLVGAQRSVRDRDRPATFWPWPCSTTAPGPRSTPAGDFATAGGVTVNHVARWDGSAWSALGAPSGTGIDGDRRRPGRLRRRLRARALRRRQLHHRRRA